jgi:hypothetical protein
LMARGFCSRVGPPSRRGAHVCRAARGPVKAYRALHRLRFLRFARATPRSASPPVTAFPLRLRGFVH